MTQSNETSSYTRPIRQIVRRAMALLWLEALWPVIWPALAVIGLFIAIALMDFLPAFNGWVHLAVICAFVAALGWACYHGLKAWRRPRRYDAERRIEQNNGLAHRPLTALQDKLVPNHDSTARTLWAVYQKRILKSLGALKTGWLRADRVERDPYAVRGGVFLLLVIGIAVGFNDPGKRLWRAVTPAFAETAVLPVELDAWINPPPYTQRAPIRLSLAEGTQPLEVPAGSKLLARLFGGAGEPHLTGGGGQHAFIAKDAHNFVIEYPLDEAGPVTLMQGQKQLAAWQIALQPDIAPTIAWTEPLAETERGALDITYTAADDYGLKSVWMEIRRHSEAAVAASTSGDRPAAEETDVIVIDLPLPSLDPKQVSEGTYADLTPHPWAGLQIAAVLVAKDALGQIGRSDVTTFTLPERRFHHPVARALIEQRKNLNDAVGPALENDPDAAAEARQTAALALSAVRRIPEAFDNDTVVRLSLTSAIQRLRGRDRETAASGVQSLLWDTALRLEDGNLSLAERKLRDAQRALQEALANDADDAEIARLSEELKKALNEYLQSLAENMQRMAEQGQQPQPFDPNAEIVDQNQLQEMIDKARELSELGAKDQAREMLQELQRMLENLRQNPMAGNPQQMQQQQQTLQELNEMMQEQQSQMDRAFRMIPRGDNRQRSPQSQRQQGQRQQGQQQQGQQQRGQQPGGQQQQGQMQGEGPMGSMAQDQESLRQRLENFLRQLQQSPGGTPEALQGAEQSMGEARDRLQGNQPGAAARAQGDALEQMAEGMRNLAEQMAEQFGQNQSGQAQQDQPMQDPMGRPTNSGNTDTSRVEIPEQSDLQRAREILNELRRRSGELTRPLFERRYIDRLMRRFD